MSNENQPPSDFGRHGEFLENAVRHILKHDPDALAFMGILPNGEFIGAYNNTSINDKLLMAGNILIDVVLDVIQDNAPEIRDMLENAEETSDDAEDVLKEADTL